MWWLWLYFRKDVEITKNKPKVNELNLKIFEIIAAEIKIDQKEIIVVSKIKTLWPRIRPI